MTAGGRALGLLGAVAPATLAILVLGCSKPRDSSGPVESRSPRVLPGVEPGASSTQDQPAGGGTSTSPHELPEYDAAPLIVTVTETVEASAVKADPDVGIVQAARATASSCFTGVSGGPDVRTAVIHVTVVPSGRVSRTEVSGAPEPELADCLRRVGDGLQFSSKEDSQRESIRSFAIDVTVSRAH